MPLWAAPAIALAVADPGGPGPTSPFGPGSQGRRHLILPDRRAMGEHYWERSGAEARSQSTVGVAYRRNRLIRVSRPDRSRRLYRVGDLEASDDPPGPLRSSGPESFPPAGWTATSAAGSAKMSQPPHRRTLIPTHRAGTRVSRIGCGAWPGCVRRCYQTRLEVGARGCAREGDDVPDVRHARGIGDRSIEAQSKAGVRHGAVSA